MRSPWVVWQCYEWGWVLTYVSGETPNSKCLGGGEETAAPDDEAPSYRCLGNIEGTATSDDSIPTSWAGVWHTWKSWSNCGAKAFWEPVRVTTNGDSWVLIHLMENPSAFWLINVTHFFWENGQLVKSIKIFCNFLSNYWYKLSFWYFKITL